MVYATLNTFSPFFVLSWLSVLLVKETGVPGENHRTSAGPTIAIFFYIVHSVHDFLYHYKNPLKSLPCLHTWKTKIHTKCNIIIACGYFINEMQVIFQKVSFSSWNTLNAVARKYSFSFGQNQEISNCY